MFPLYIKETAELIVLSSAVAVLNWRLSATPTALWQ